MTRPLEEYQIVTQDQLLHAPSPDTPAYWSLCEATLAEIEAQFGPTGAVKAVRLTDPNWSMDWLGIAIVKDEPNEQ